MITDYFRFAIQSIRNRKLRSWLTILGIFIGITSVVSLISISQGMEEAINEQFERMGTNKVIVSPGTDSGMGMLTSLMSSSKFTSRELDVVKRVKGVDIAAGMLSRVANVKYRDRLSSTFIDGIPADETMRLFEDVESFDVAEGRKIRVGDRYRAVIGDNVAHDMFKEDISLHDKILINNQEFRVVGILEPTGTRTSDMMIAIPIETARELFSEPDEISMVIVQVKEYEDPVVVGERIKDELGRFRNEKAGEETFSVKTFKQVIESFSIILDIVRVVLVGIAAISLLVGSVGVMNTMYTAVLERTREIGVMKAIGGRNSDIMYMFLIESGIYGLAGGLVGVIIGIGISKVIETLAQEYIKSGIFKASFAWWLLLGPLVFSFILGCVSGVAPARQAAGLKPVEALRHE